MSGHRDEPGTEGVLVSVEGRQVADDRHPGLGCDVLADIGSTQDVEVAEEQWLGAPKQPCEGVRVARTRAAEHSSELVMRHQYRCRPRRRSSVTRMTSRPTRPG